MIKLKNILAEEVYGNKATVYHRTETRELLRIILNNDFKNSCSMYGEGIYTTYEPTKKTDWEAPNPQTGDPEKDNPEGRDNYVNYGPFQVKFSVDLINFFIFDWDVYKTVKPHIAKIEKFTKQKSDQNNFINLQAEYFKMPHRINTPYKKRYTSEVALKFGFKEKYKYSDNSSINGIVFFGSRDGNVLVCYNTSLLIPLSMTNSDTNTTVNLQKVLNSDMKLKNEFKNYFKRFLINKNAAMNNVVLNKFDIEKNKWTYDKTTNMYSYNGNVEATDDIVKNGKLIIKFDTVGGNFICNATIESLEGCPKKVGGNFYCNRTALKSLKGAPHTVGGSFYCNNTNIESLEGAPLIVGGDFQCQRTKITSLKGSPKKIGGSFDCSTTGIESLNWGPSIVKGLYNCFDTPIKSLVGSPKKIGNDFYCGGTNIESLEGAPLKVNGEFDCEDCLELKSLEHLPIAKKYYVPSKFKDELHRILKERGEIK